VEGCDVVVTVTPSRQPLVSAAWLEPGTHLTAVGSDGPDKQELMPEVLARADRVVADRLSQCLELGEIHHAVRSGALDPARVVELGTLAAGGAGGRGSAREITVADLTGVGVQDAAVAGHVVLEALRRGVGRPLDAR
jgi:ornithine cyclodeaminase